MAETRTIQLTQGQVTVVDAGDYDWLSRYTWYAVKKPNTFYAARKARMLRGKRTVIYMHQVILGTSAGMESDHRNGDGLDNRRANLRICTHQENGRNSKLSKRNTSGHKGVHWHVRDKRWCAQIKITGKRLHLGCYSDIGEAVAAYNSKAKEVFGEFARTT